MGMPVRAGGVAALRTSPPSRADAAAQHGLPTQRAACMAHR
jgi:hypothetical protein